MAGIIGQSLKEFHYAGRFLGMALGLTAGNTIDYRAIGPIITVALLDEMQQRAPHRVQFQNLPVDFRDMFGRQRLNVATGAGTVVPQIQELCDILDRKAQTSRPLNEAQRIDIDLTEISIPGFGSLCRWDEANAFIVADRL
jgi:hypothetical protein